MTQILLFLWVSLLVPPLLAEESAERIVHKMVERDKELVRHRAQYLYTVGITREKLDGESKVLKTTSEELLLQADQSPDYGTRDTKGIEGDVQQAAQEEPFNILNIISHYDYALVDSENLEGVPCYKIKFTPKGNQPFRNREEKVANELAGFMWIAKADYSLARNTGKLAKPVSVAWFFATLREMEFLFEAKRLPNGELGPSRIQYRFRVQVPFTQIHERHTRIMKEYTVRTKK